MNINQIANELNIRPSSVQKILDSGIEIQIDVEKTPVCLSDTIFYKPGQFNIRIGNFRLMFDPISGNGINVFEEIELSSFIKFIQLFESELR